jgi:Fe-S oxidoreductase
LKREPDPAAHGCASDEVARKGVDSPMPSGDAHLVSLEAFQHTHPESVLFPHRRADADVDLRRDHEGWTVPTSAPLAGRPWQRYLKGRLNAVLGMPGARTRNPRPRETRERDFSNELYSAMNGCLGCRACASDCPLKQHQAQLKDAFVQLHHRRHPRRSSDYLIAGFEYVAPWLARAPRLSNSLLSASGTRWASRKFMGLVHIPQVSVPTLHEELRRRCSEVHTRRSIRRLTPSSPDRHVWLVQDVFTSFYEPEVSLAVFDLLRELGYEPFVLPYLPNGRALQTKGFVGLHRRTAEHTARLLSHAGAHGMPLLGIDPVVTLSFRDHYPRGDIEPRGFRVLLLEEWLDKERDAIRENLGQHRRRSPRQRGCWLLPHCTERDAADGSQRLWQQAFDLFGLELQLSRSACCRKSAGSECEVRQRAPSGELSLTNWRAILPRDEQLSRRYMATGYSCRRQIMRSAGVVVRHPAQVLLEILRGETTSVSV